MTTFIGLLRAVNVGGTGKLPMAQLRALCTDIGFSKVETYIASGNLLFDTLLDIAAAKQTLEAALARHMGKPVGVVLKTLPQLQEIAAQDPFVAQPPNQRIIMFYDGNDIGSQELRHQNDEQVVFGAHAIYIYYPSNMGRSKLTLKITKPATGRNANTLAKLIALAEAR